jgi:hypothetical protein
MDDCGIDLIHLPINIQCKAGYNKNRPKYEELFQSTKLLLQKHFPANDPVHNYPYVLINKLNTTKKLSPEFMQVTISYEFFLKLIELANDRL